MDHATRKKVKEHPPALRQQVLNECAQPGATAAKLALVHGLNANLVHACRSQERDKAARQNSVAPPAAAAGDPQRTLGRVYAALDAGAVVRARRRGAGAAVRRAQALVLDCGVLHADETPAVVYEFFHGLGAQYPIKFLGPPREGERQWQGTLVRDEFSAYEAVLDAKEHPGRVAAGCAAHASRKFDERLKSKASAIAPEALRRFADIYCVEREIADKSSGERLAKRQEITKPLWQSLRQWLEGRRQIVPDGGAAAKAIDYCLSTGRR